MGDPKRIWLQPECCTSPYDGRQWCEDNVFECDDGNPSVEYTRADLAAEQIEALKHERNVLQKICAERSDDIDRLEAERRELVHSLRVIHSFAYGDDAHDMDPEDLLERIRIESYKCIAKIDAQRKEQD